ncbi:hypothetical protein ACN6LL_003272, partial [Streptomyces violaceoruber]
KELFGRLADGTKVYRWSLENGGTRMKVLSYGGGRVRRVEQAQGRFVTDLGPRHSRRGPLLLTEVQEPHVWN